METPDGQGGQPAHPADGDGPPSSQPAKPPPGQPPQPQMPPPPQMPTFPGQAAPETPPGLPPARPPAAQQPGPADSPLGAPTEKPAEAPASDSQPEPSLAATDLPPSVAPSVGDGVAAAPLDDQAQGPGSDPVDEADWLDRICPYLLSEDGTYRSTQPDDGHRCTAQDPPGTLPLAFQERFCLTDRFVRCEMFKYAQDARSAAAGDSEDPVEQVKSARFKPSVRSVPVAMGPSESGEAEPPSRRPMILVAAAIGAFILFILIVILLSGGGDGSTGGPGASPDPAATDSSVAASTPEATTAATPGSPATTVPGRSPEQSVAPVTTEQLIEYEVQEGEALVKISEAFGTTRRRIIRSNEGMAEKTPYVVTGDVIIVPASGELTIEELEAVPGFQRLLE